MIDPELFSSVFDYLGFPEAFVVFLGLGALSVLLSPFLGGVNVMGKHLPSYPMRKSTSIVLGILLLLVWGTSVFPRTLYDGKLAITAVEEILERAQADAEEN